MRPKSKAIPRTLTNSIQRNVQALGATYLVHSFPSSIASATCHCISIPATFLPLHATTHSSVELQSPWRLSLSKCSTKLFSNFWMVVKFPFPPPPTQISNQVCLYLPCWIYTFHCRLLGLVVKFLNSWQRGASSPLKTAIMISFVFRVGGNGWRTTSPPLHLGVITNKTQADDRRPRKKVKLIIAADNFGVAHFFCVLSVGFRFNCSQRRVCS